MGKSDRELLELAAKAAGLQLCGYSWIGENEDDEECEILESAFVKIHPEQEIATKWNPLTDDGDALRLAVRLHMSPSWSPSKKSVKASIENDPFLVFGIDATGDDCADIRRIIVMSAAAIGEATQ